MNIKCLFSLALLLSAATPAFAQDTRPIASFAALPRVGTIVPHFNFALHGGGTVSDSTLRGRPAIIALWATWCGGSQRINEQIDSLAIRYAGKPVTVLVLAQDPPAELEAFLQKRPARALYAPAENMLPDIFDHSATAPEKATMRVEWALPLWLVLDKTGRVAYRNGGPRIERLQSVVDSLLATP